MSFSPDGTLLASGSKDGIQSTALLFFALEDCFQAFFYEPNESSEPAAVCAAAVDYGSAFVSGGEDEVIDADFDAAFITEFGLSIEQYSNFVGRSPGKPWSKRTAHFRLPRSEVVRRLREVDALDPCRDFKLPASNPDEEDIWLWQLKIRVLPITFRIAYRYGERFTSIS